MQRRVPIKEKEVILATMLSEHAQVQKNNTVCLPVAHLYAKELDTSDADNILWALRDKGVIKSYLHCWGAYESAGGSRHTFVASSTEEAINDGDFEAYKIELIPAKFERYFDEQRPSQDAAKIVLHLSKEGDLYKEPREKFLYPMSAKGVPLKIIRHFSDTPTVEYEGTDSLAAKLSMETQAVRTEIGKLRNAVRKPLGLGNADLIESRKNSGYRLNPNISIRLED